MINIRSFPSVGWNVVLAAGVALSAVGCGSGGDGTQAEVSPDFQKKTADMLNQKSKDQMAKYKQSKGKH